jgi:hypothetical protein
MRKSPIAGGTLRPFAHQTFMDSNGLLAEIRANREG